MKYLFNILTIALCTVLLLPACKKDFLDAKPDINMIIPDNLDALQALLDNAGKVSVSFRGNQEIANDDLLAPDNIYLSETVGNQVLYTWEDDPGLYIYDWTAAYSNVFLMNSVLEGVRKVAIENPGDAIRKDNIKGSALFFRGIIFWDLLQNFASVYEPSAAEEPGIVLPLSNNVQERLGRSSVEESYQQVVKDLKEALPLLPDEVVFKTRPNRCAGYSALARVYLSMGKYQQAGLYADSALRIYSTLIDYNTLQKPLENSNPFVRFNDEVIFQSMLPSKSITGIGSTAGFVDTTLYAQYEENDLRKKLFFAKVGDYYRLSGRYSGISNGFGGFATDELYLISAECKARAAKFAEAMQDLNTLLQTRWMSGTYIPFSAANETDALQLILAERRKQLLFRGLRWTDLKRLNKDPRFAVTLSRVVTGTQYTLPPNDPRYLFLIPNDELFLNPLVSQNPR